MNHVFTWVYSQQSDPSKRVNWSEIAVRTSDQQDWDQYISSINCGLHTPIDWPVPGMVVYGEEMVTNEKEYTVLRNLCIFNIS